MAKIFEYVNLSYKMIMINKLELKKEYFDKGMQFINYSKKQEWQEFCIDYAREDKELKLAYNVMETLENGCGFEN